MTMAFTALPSLTLSSSSFHHHQHQDTSFNTQKPLFISSSSSSSSSVFTRIHTTPMFKLTYASLQVVYAVTAEAEVEEEEEVAAVATPTPTQSKPKTGKTALPLKRDRTRSKRFLDIQKLRQIKQEYDLKTAISLMKHMCTTKFVETAEVHFRLNIDPKYNHQQLRATVKLPKGTGHTVKVAVLAQGDKIDEANAAGANIVGGSGGSRSLNLG